MAKAFRSIAALALMVSGSLSAASAGERPVLRHEAAVAGELVRIGDLVAHAGPVADIAIFRAPDLGHTGAVSTAHILDAARRHGLANIDTRGLAEVAVTRLSRSVGAKEIEERVMAALSGRRGLGDTSHITITFDREPRTFQLEPTSGELSVARAIFEPSSARFDVTFEANGSAAAQGMRLRYTGTAIATMDVAVLVRPLARGDVARAGDIVIERRPRAAIAAGALQRIEQVAGLAARRALPASQALRAADLMKPELVRQNELVTVVYDAPGISLSMRGKALESGAEGDIVSVANIQTKRTMQGVVAGPGRVSIPSTTTQVATRDGGVTSSIAATTPQQRTE